MVLADAHVERACSLLLLMSFVRNCCQQCRWYAMACAAGYAMRSCRPAGLARESLMLRQTPLFVSTRDDTAIVTNIPKIILFWYFKLFY